MDKQLKTVVKDLQETLQSLKDLEKPKIEEENSDEEEEKPISIPKPISTPKLLNVKTSEDVLEIDRLTKLANTVMRRIDLQEMQD